MVSQRCLKNSEGYLKNVARVFQVRLRGDLRRISRVCCGCFIDIPGMFSKTTFNADSMALFLKEQATAYRGNFDVQCTLKYAFQNPREIFKYWPR